MQDIKQTILELKLEADKCWLTDTDKYNFLNNKIKEYEYKIKNGKTEKLREQDNHIALDGDGFTYQTGQTYVLSKNKNRHYKFTNKQLSK